MIQKALTFRASSIGDCLMGKYLLENIHAEYPQARLGIVVASRAGMIRDLFAAYPWLEVIEANRRNPGAVLSLLRTFHGSDLVITQYAGKKGGKFGLASKLVARILAKRGGLIGFSDASIWNTFLYDKLLPVRPERAVADHDREALQAAGIPIALPYPTLQYLKDPETLPKLRIEGKFILVHLFAGNKSRGLSPEKKKDLLAALAEQLPDTHLVITGGKGDREESLQVAKGIPATVIAGDVTLQQLMNVIGASQGVVSIDTGVAHIAAQLGKPLVVLHTCLGRNWWLPEQYGPATPIKAFSRGDLCAVGHVHTEYPACINAIPVEAVIQAVLSSQTLRDGG